MTTSRSPISGIVKLTTVFSKEQQKLDSTLPLILNNNNGLHLVFGRIFILLSRERDQALQRARLGLPVICLSHQDEEIP